MEGDEGFIQSKKPCGTFCGVPVSCILREHIIVPLLNKFVIEYTFESTFLRFDIYFLQDKVSTTTCVLNPFIRIHTTDWTSTVIQSLQNNNDNTIFDEAGPFNDDDDDDERKGTKRMPRAKIRRNVANKT